MNKMQTLEFLERRLDTAELYANDYDNLEPTERSYEEGFADALKLAMKLINNISK